MRFRPAGVREDEVEELLRRTQAVAPTPQRIARAAAEGQTAEFGGDGEGEVAWRISPALDDLLRRGTLEHAEHAAAMKFLRHYYLGLYAGPKTPGYKERINGGGGAGDYEDRRVHYAIQVERAIFAVDPLFHRALSWMVGSLTNPSPLSKLGAYYAPNLGAQTQSARGGQALATACAMLCRHYGMQHRLNIDARLNELSRYLQIGKR